MSLELSGTTGVKGVAGSVSAPSIVGDDTNTGISFPAADTIKFSTGGVERMSITDSGVTATGIPIVPPAFRAAKTATYQVLSNSANIKITFEDVSTNGFDTNSFYDTSNSRFQPTIAGYYYFDTNVRYSNATGNYLYALHLYKNGAQYIRGVFWNDGSNSDVQISTSGIVPLNGSSDYVEVYGYQNSGGNISLIQGASSCHFTGFYLRPL